MFILYWMQVISSALFQIRWKKKEFGRCQALQQKEHKYSKSPLEIKLNMLVVQWEKSCKYWNFLLILRICYRKSHF